MMLFGKKNWRNKIFLQNQKRKKEEKNPKIYKFYFEAYFDAAYVCV